MYVEIYRLYSQGAFGSDLIEQYLTDSVSFRVRVGVSDEYYDLVYFKPLINDSILVERSRRSDDVNGTLKVIRSDVYSIKSLKELDNIRKNKKIELSSLSLSP